MIDIRKKNKIYKGKDKVIIPKKQTKPQKQKTIPPSIQKQMDDEIKRLKMNKSEVKNLVSDIIKKKESNE